MRVPTDREKRMVRELRRRGLSQQEIARRLGLSQSTVSKILRASPSA